MSIDTTPRPPQQAPSYYGNPNTGHPRGGVSAARRRVGITLLSLVLAAALVGVVFAVYSYASARAEQIARQAVPALSAGVSEPQSAAPAALTPAQAQAKTCVALRENYPAVSAAIDEREKYNTRPWSDPELLASVNSLVDSMNSLTVALEGSLSPETPSALRTATLEYIAGLRALSISERNHASNVQLNGTGLFYNQVVDAPLKICGING